MEIGDIELKGEMIAFQFREHVNTQGMFDEVGHGIIQIANNTSHQRSANDPRWGTIIKIGPDVKDPGLVPGAQILIKELRWSFGIPLEGTTEKFHVTKECEILAVEEG